MARKPQTAWQKLGNNVLSRSEALLYALVILAVGVAAGGIAGHYCW